MCQRPSINLQTKDECGRQVTGDTPWKSSQVKSSQVKSRNLPRAPPPLPQVLTGSYDPLDIKGTTENVYRVVASYWASGIPCTARARRAVVASMDPMQRAARHAMPMAGTTALQDLLAEVAGRRRALAGERRPLRGARYSCEDPRSRPRAARGGACGAGDGGCTDDACEESHAAARGGDGTAAQPQLTAAPLVLSDYVRGKGYSFPRPINGLCNSRLIRPRLRPLR